MPFVLLVIPILFVSCEKNSEIPATGEEVIHYALNELSLIPPEERNFCFAKWDEQNQGQNLDGSSTNTHEPSGSLTTRLPERLDLFGADPEIDLTSSPESG